MEYRKTKELLRNAIRKAPRSSAQVLFASDDPIIEGRKELIVDNPERAVHGDPKSLPMPVTTNPPDGEVTAERGSSTRNSNEVNRHIRSAASGSPKLRRMKKPKTAFEFVRQWRMLSKAVSREGGETEKARYLTVSSELLLYYGTS